MGYFSNGTEGDVYQERYCNRCVHDVNQDCPIWLMHLIHNGEDGAWGVILDTFIPRKDVHNGECVMFVEVSNEERDKYLSEETRRQRDEEMLDALVTGRGITAS